MARRKNTADCREVLRKVFEAETADGTQAGQGAREKKPAGEGQSLNAGKGRGSPGISERQAKPLLGKPESDSSESVHRHGGIRSAAPGVAAASRFSVHGDAPGEAGFPGEGGGLQDGLQGPGEGAGTPAPFVSEAEEAGAVEARDSGPEAGCGGFPEEKPDGFTGEGEDRFEGLGEESPGGEDPAAIRVAAGLLQGEQPADDCRDARAETGGDGTGPADRRQGSLAGLVEWFLKDDSIGVFGQSVQVRASTLVLSGLVAAIVVGLLGLYFSIDHEEGTLAGRILDERQAQQGAAGSVGVAAGSASLNPGKEDASSGSRGSLRTSLNPPARVGRPAGGTIPGRPLWSRNSTSGIQLPPVRKVESSGTARAAAFVTTSATRWLRVRDLMGKEECAKLLDHLKRLQQHLREKNGCADGSIACKELRSRMKERHGEQLYAVDIGPFSSWNLAQQAAAVLKETTRQAPWVFRSKKEYFAESYPRKP